MIRHSIDWGGFGSLRGLSARAQTQVPVGAARAITHVTRKAATQMRRETARQTGLAYGVMVRALKVKAASPATLEAHVRSRGGNLSLRNYKPRETRAGVSAAPPGGRKTFAGTFLKGGRFPGRIPLKLGGHVFRRAGAGRLPIRLQKSGYFIPDEMVSGASAQAFHRIAAGELPGRLAHELRRLF